MTICRVPPLSVVIRGRKGRIRRRNEEEANNCDERERKREDDRDWTSFHRQKNVMMKTITIPREKKGEREGVKE